MMRYFLLFSLLSLSFTQAKKNNSALSSPVPLQGLIVYSARIDAHIRSNQSSAFVDSLIFNRKKSMFKWHQKNGQNKDFEKLLKKYPNAKVEKSDLENDQVGRYNVYEVSKDSLFSRRVFLSLHKIYLLKEKNPAIHWNISDSTKQIGNFICTKATARFRGRDYTAWFAPKIPVPYGPWKLVGLPGAILQVHDRTNDISFRAQKIKLNYKGHIGSMPLNGKEEVIDLAKYKRIMSHLQKLKTQQAHKSTRKYRRKYGRHVIVQYHIIKPNPLEIFSDTTGR